LSPRFARKRKLQALIDAVANRYNCRPSDILNGNHEDLQMDIFCMESGIKASKKHGR
jgi:hypothetical protein